MKISDLLAQLRTQMAAKLNERNTKAEELEKLRGETDADETKVSELRQAKTDLDAELDALLEREKELKSEQARDDAATRLAGEVNPTGAGRRSYDDVARIGQEARTYTAETSRAGVSFFRDAYASQFRGDMHARTRLERHSNEVTAERELSERAATTGSFAGLVVPQYLVDQAALIARAGRPFANTCQNLPLPPNGMSLLIPRGTTGASAAIQATENAAVSSTDQVWANLTVPVVTIAGQAPVSRQSLERGSDVDTLIYRDLVGAYAVALDAQVLAGTGSSGQMLGVTNTAGVNQATAFTAAATAQTYMSKVAGQINAVETTRFMAPTNLAVAPRRWNWLTVQPDSAGRPLTVPETGGPVNAFGVSSEPIDTPSADAAGRLLGLPTITDANIPQSVGTGPEDLTIVYRGQDLLLWEDNDGMPRELSFEQTNGPSLQTVLVVYNYAAFTAGRYPTSVGLVGGNAGTIGFGTVAPTF